MCEFNAKVHGASYLGLLVELYFSLMRGGTVRGQVDMGEASHYFGGFDKAYRRSVRNITDKVVQGSQW